MDTTTLVIIFSFLSQTCRLVERLKLKLSLESSWG
jgi:hypothetical protein